MTENNPLDMNINEAINKAGENQKIVISEKILITKCHNIDNVAEKIKILMSNRIVSKIKEIRTLQVSNYYITLIKANIIENKIGDWIIVDEKEEIEL